MHLSYLTALVGLFSLAPAIAFPQTSSSTSSNKRIAASRAKAVAIALTSAKLTPQGIKSGISPKVEVNVAYGSKKVHLGNSFSTLETTKTTHRHLHRRKDHDPDAPDPTADGAPATLSFLLYQATFNASFDCVNPTITAAAPHRYTQLVYRQPNGFTPPASLALTTSNPDLNGFVAADQWVLVGVTFFREWL